jgi:ABC-type phosphonate transport system ATPase subunit
LNAVAIVIFDDSLSGSFKEEDMDIVNRIQNYKPPKYLIDSLFEAGKVYSITGLAGSGKTTAATCLAWHTTTGTNLGNRTVKQGRVAYFCGEDDIDRRIIGMTNGNIPRGVLKVVNGAGRQKAEVGIARLIAKREDIAW